MDDLIKRLRRAKLRHESGYMKDVGFLLDEAADALEAAREDAARYRWLADNRCDVTMCASATDYGDGDTTFGPRVEIDPEQFGPEYGSPKAKLDAAIDAAREAAAMSDIKTLPLPKPTLIGKKVTDLLTCYQCGKTVTWLAPDSRCGDCTRLTPDEVRG